MSHRNPIAVVFAALFALLTTPASAQLLVPAEPGSAVSHVPLAVRNSHIRVEVDSQVARTKIVQVFENNTDTTLEGHYVFPVPESAAVSGFATWVDGRRVESQVQQKDDAERTYAAAKREGRAPGLLSQFGPGIFKTKVDGIRPRKTRRIELDYAEVLPYQDGEVTLRLPLSTPGIAPPAVEDFRISVEVSDRTKKLGRLWSTTHDIEVFRVDDQHVTVSLVRSNYTPDQDLVLRYKVESDDLGLTFMTHRPDGEDGYFMLSIAPQELTTAKDIVKKDIVFVFDTSGSMDGGKLPQARSALEQCLGLLNAGDRFSVLAFSDGMNPWKNTVVEASPENLAGARGFIDGLRAMGGTNINGALEESLRIARDRGRPRVVVFFTDGEPTIGERNPSTILANVAAANTGGARIFTFGVGAADRRLLKDLAVNNRGASDFVEPGQAIDEVVAGFYSKISKPVLSDIDFDYAPATVALQYPTVMPDIYKGQQLIIVGRYRGSGTGTVKLRGLLNGEERELITHVDFPKARMEDAFVARIWARKRVQFLLDEMNRNGEDAEMKDEVVRLAMAHHLVTPYTSLVTRAEPVLASLAPSRIKPGDPEVRIPAPENARAVKVFLPFGEVLDAKWDAELGLWVARFLVPTDATDGVYPVRIVIQHADGHGQTLALSYTIDTRAPVLAVEVPAPVPAGELFALSARPRVSVGSVAAALMDSRAGDLVEVAKTFSDVRSVTAHLWDGRELELGLEPGHGWTAEVETATTQAPGRYPVTVTAVDWAGNLHRQKVEVEVR